ncbi:MAG TPA: hypothetical protein VFB68_10095 [Xanthobacteraceae bacterium]|nr:hypothetical protein [Xanthobacteraceae bacterium]
MQTVELPGATNLPIFVAKEKGFFEKAGAAFDNVVKTALTDPSKYIGLTCDTARRG